MARIISAKCRQCRRIGEKLFIKGEKCYSQKCAMVKRNFPPGVHGAKGKGKQSDFAIQLQEKQKARKIYGVMEKQFRLTFDKAKKIQGDTGENFFKLLETRLDNVIYRLGFAKSRNQARQLVSHYHFKVNKKKINIPSFKVKEGDIIEIKETDKKLKPFVGLNEKLQKHIAPSWLNLDLSNMTGKVLHAPKEDDLKSIGVNAQMIVEFYSR